MEPQVRLPERARVGADESNRSSVRNVILGVAALGGAALVGAAAASWSLSRPDTPAWAVLSAVIALAEAFPISVRVGEETEDFLMTDVAFTTGLLTTPGHLLLFAIAAGVLDGNVIRRTPPHKALFNVGLDLTGMALAVAVAGLFPALSLEHPASWAGAAAGMLGYFVTN